MTTNNLALLTARLSTALRDPDFETWEVTEIQDLVQWAVADLYPRISREIPYTSSTITLVSETYVYNVPRGILHVSSVDWVDSQDIQRGRVNGWRTVGDPLVGALRLHIPPIIVEQGGTLRVLGNGRYGTTSYPLSTSAESDDIIDTAVRHPFTAGTVVMFHDLTGGTGISENTPYYVISTSLADTTFQISTSLGGTAAGWSTDISAGNVSECDLIPDEIVPLVLAIARAEAYRRVASDRVQFKQWQEVGETDTSVNSLIALMNEADSEANAIRRRHRTWQRPVPGRLA